MKKSFLLVLLASLLTNFIAHSQIESFPDLMEMGVKQSNLGNYAMAQAAFTKALALKPDDAIAHYNRAVTKANLKDNRGAINDFDKALEDMPMLSRDVDKVKLVKKIIKGHYKIIIAVWLLIQWMLILIICVVLPKLS